VQPDFWHARWGSGQIGFHLTSVHTELRARWPELGVAREGRVLVPLCGKSLDLLWLRDRGHHTVGVELSSVAVEAFCTENGVPARRRRSGEFQVYETPDLELRCGDFFALTSSQLGAVAAVYDRAALISWTEELRQPYVSHLAELTPIGAQTLLITMEYPQAEKAGPPFSISPTEVDRLYGKHHLIRQLARRDILASEPKMRARGVTELYEVSYQLIRR
jgi:thiopurine S-methyltransferase